MSNIAICLQCEHGAAQGRCNGRCICAVGSRKIQDHARAGDCPLKLFSEAAPAKRSSGGPGTELVTLLARIGITATSGCKCKVRAAMMDANGAEWCRANTDTIIGWLREEAERRGMLFVETAARLLLWVAIRRWSGRRSVRTAGQR